MTARPVVLLPLMRDSPEHRKYLRSPRWRATRLSAIVRWGGLGPFVPEVSPANLDMVRR